MQALEAVEPPSGDLSAQFYFCYLQDMGLYLQRFVSNLFSYEIGIDNVIETYLIGNLLTIRFLFLAFGSRNHELTMNNHLQHLLI